MFVIDILTTISEWLFHFTCHQQPDLLVQICDHALPFCYRCGGIYLGIAMVLPLLTIIRKFSGRWLLGLGLVAITLCEWLLANQGFTSSSMVTRTLTGFLAGVGLVFVISEYVVSPKVNLIYPFLLVMIVWLIRPINEFVELIVTLSFLIFWFTALSIITQRVSTIIKREFFHAKAKSSA